MSLGTTSACAENTSVTIATKSCKWNYLRVRGEYKHMKLDHSFEEELPPRARRIRQTPRTLNQSIGTTSACAENTQ